MPTSSDEEQAAKFVPQTLEPTTATCNCGAVELELKNPQMTMACHCHDCRGRNGTLAAYLVTSKSADVIVAKGDDNITTFGKSHPDGSNKGPRVCFCKTCGTHTHYKSFGGAVTQVPLCLTAIKDQIQDVGLHIWKSSSVPCSKGIFESAQVPVFDGLPSGAPMDAFMAIIKD